MSAACILERGNGVKMQITMLAPAWSMDDAARRMSKRSKRFFIKGMGVVFYPYLKVTFRIDMGEKLKRYNSKTVCLIDMYTGRYSLAKSFGKYETIEVEDACVMPVKLEREEAIANAPLEICAAVMAKKRFPRIPDIIAEDDELFYKPFYVTECTNDDGEFFHMLFDAVMGDFSLLNA
jgi:hypothetical protein